MRIETERKMRRWREQRWILDQVIQTRGIDWDQGRTGKIMRNCGPGVQSDLQEVCSRIKNSSISRASFPAPPRAAKNRAREPKPPANSPTRASTIISPRVSTPTPCGRFTKTAIRSASPGRNASAPATTNSFNTPAGPLNGSSCPTKAKRSTRCCICLPTANPAKKFPASCTFPAWTASKKITRLPAIRFRTRLRRSCHRRPRPGRNTRRRHQMHRLQLRRCRKACLDYLVKRPEIDADRLGVMALEHGLLLGAARRRRRAPFQSLRGERRLHGAGPVRDLQHVVADFQAQLHVHVRLRRRSGFRRIRQNAVAQRRYSQDHLSLYGRCR